MSPGPLIIDVAGCSLTAEDVEVLGHPLVGGVILFTRNFKTSRQVTELTGHIHGMREPRLLVLIDQEGGPVQRFRDGFTHLPAAVQFGRYYDHDPAQALKLTQDAGWLLATELAAVGVDHSFTPVLDCEVRGSKVLKDRTYHRDVQVIAELAHRLMKGLQEGGMQATGKHFPGHGGVRGDSHTELPVDTRAYEDIYAHGILPFERMIHYGLSGIMPAHVVYEQVDSSPAGFSRIWLREILRTQLEFNGVIFSDDISMAGAHAAGGYTERTEAALEAGCDVVLACNNRAGVVAILEQLQYSPNPVLHSRLAHMRGRHTGDLETFRGSVRWKKTVDAMRLLNDEFPVERELDF